MRSEEKEFAVFFSLLGRFIAIVGIGITVLYAVFMVVWLHAPPLKILLFTAPVVCVLLAIAWALKKSGMKHRQ